VTLIENLQGGSGRRKGSKERKKRKERKERKEKKRKERKEKVMTETPHST